MAPTNALVPKEVHLALAGWAIIPEGWEVQELGQLISDDRGISVGVMYPGNHDPSGPPLIKVTDLSGSRINPNPAFHISTAKHHEYRRTALEGGELLLTLVGDVGQCAVVPKSMAGWNAARAVAVIRLLNPSDASFVRLCLLSRPLQHLMQVWSNTTVQTTLNLKEIKQLPIPWPPKLERDRIVTILGALDDKIELNRRMNETLEAMARALFRSWFVDFDPVRVKAEGRQPTWMDAATAVLFPDGFEESVRGLIPNGWAVSELGHVADVIDCLHNKKPDRQDHGRPLLQLWNIKDNGLIDMTDTFWISEDDYQTWTMRLEAQEGDCVITNVGRVGAVAQVPPNLKAALGRNMTGIRCASHFPFPTFLLQCLLSTAMRDEIERKTDTGTILDALNVRNISTLRFVRPPDRLAQAFETNCRPIRAMMEQTLSESRTLSDIRDTLLPKLLSGDIRVKEVEQAVGTAL